MTFPCRRQYTTSILLAVFVLLLGVAASTAQHPDQLTPTQEVDVSWLATIQKPEVVVDWVVMRYDSVSQSLVIDNLWINWHDSLDASLEDHSIKKAFSCTPIGTLVDEGGDSVQVDYKRSRIEIVKKDGSSWIYRMISTVTQQSGAVPTSTLSGSLLLMINAAKVVDRRYTIEGSASVPVEVTNVLLQDAPR